MAFSPNDFLSTMKGLGGPAKSSLFAVVIPIPTYINNYVTYKVTDAITNFRNDLVNSFIDPITSFINESLGRGPISEEQRTSNVTLSRQLAFLCEGAELPGKSFLTHEAKVYGPTFKVPYLAQYQDMNMTFLCTRAMPERIFFDRWMQAILPTDTNNPRFPKSEKSRYLTNIQIFKYDEQAQNVLQIELIDAYPVSMAAQSMSWSDDAFLRLNVSFAYQSYRVVFNGGFNPSQENLINFGLNRP